MVLRSMLETLPTNTSIDERVAEGMRTGGGARACRRAAASRSKVTSNIPHLALATLIAITSAIVSSLRFWWPGPASLSSPLLFASLSARAPVRELLATPPAAVPLHALLAPYSPPPKPAAPPATRPAARDCWPPAYSCSLLLN